MRTHRSSLYANAGTPAVLRRMGQRGQRAFTMIEIAITVGVIGFAMVAIIGILPFGMNSQKDNREDTMVSQDAPYFLNAIRDGEQRTNANVLTGYVESIVLTSTNPSPGFTNIYSNPYLGGTNLNYLTNDMAILGILTTPQFDLRTNVITQVSAIVRAMSGSVLQQNGANKDTAFRYQLTVEINPWSYNTGYIPTNASWPPSYLPQAAAQSVAAAYTNSLTASLHEMRLTFAWPVLPNNTVGPSRQTYRTLIGSHLGMSNNFQPTFWFFQPLSYTTNFTGT